MAYIDFTYYSTVYMGTPIPEAEFGPLAERATDIVDMITSYKIKMAKNGISDYPTFIQDQIKKATAAQTEYLFNKGGSASLNGSSGDDISSAGIGNFNYQEGSSESNLSREQKLVSPLIMNYLGITGLLNRSVDVHSSHAGCCTWL